MPSTFADPANSFHEKAVLCRAAENSCYFATVKSAKTISFWCSSLFVRGSCWTRPRAIVSSQNLINGCVVPKKRRHLVRGLGQILAARELRNWKNRQEETGCIVIGNREQQSRSRRKGLGGAPGYRRTPWRWSALLGGSHRNGYLSDARRIARRTTMHRFTRLVVAVLLIGCAEAILAQGGPPDAAFTAIPFDRWIEEGNQAHIRWTARVLPVELSNHQRLQAKVELQVDGNELVRRRGKGYLVMLVQFSDNENRVYQTHEALDLQLVKEDTGKSNFSYTQAAFVMPGDYRISLAILDTTTGEHSAMRLPLHVSPLKNDSLPDSWHDLSPVEILKAADSPEDLFLPNVTGRLHLPLETHRPVRVEILVNASPLSTGEP